MAVETAILSREAREGPTRKQCLSKALKKAREGSVGLSQGSVYSLWEQQVQRATYHQRLHFSSWSKAITPALPSPGNMLLPSNSSSSF